MRPARVSEVSAGAITSMRSKPQGRSQKSVTATEWPLLPMSDATTVCSPSQVRACASPAPSGWRSPTTMASWMAAKVRPGMVASQPAGVAMCDSRSGSRVPRPQPSGSACTME
ncbi:hypothetical protein D9M69_632890 [compost metagenome]